MSGRAPDERPLGPREHGTRRRSLLRAGLAPLAWGAVVLGIAGCGGEAPSPSPASASADADLVPRAVAILERGSEGVVPATKARGASKTVAGSASSDGSDAPFHDFDERVRGFLASPDLLDAVQFSCAVREGGAETWVQSGLDDPDPAVRLRALVVLVRVRAPRSVDRQWAVLEELSHGPRAAAFADVTTRVRAAFAPEALDRVLKDPPPGVPPSTPPSYPWALRAAGVTRHAAALPRLTELSRSDRLDVSLAAERSLEDFAGREGDAALAACVDGWRYDAALRAARALKRRDPELLRATLLAAAPPDDQAHWKGLFLAHLGDRRGVPILCDKVPGLQIVDHEMFDAIERLAGPEDLPAVEALPTRVRKNQQARADEVVAAVRTRLAAGR